MKKYGLVIHGGAGTIRPDMMTPVMEASYHQTLRKALEQGQSCLMKEGQALDAVALAVMILEDSPLFNAGKGAVFTHDGHHELEAAIMSGKDLKAGAVAGLKRIKNPIQLAKKVLLESKHVMMIGEGAEYFGKKHHCEMVKNGWFSTEMRRKQLEAVQDSDELILDHSNLKEIKKFGTVGAVALDQYGNLAAATSTGGITNKRWGRVGDSSLIGCGTYAENGVAAVSATGYGEAFIRRAVAYDVMCRIKYAKQTLETATNLIIHQEIPQLGGDGGLIAIDAFGNISMPFNTAGMYRGYANETTLETLIYNL